MFNMFKVFLISLTIVCCGAQLDFSRIRLATLGGVSTWGHPNVLQYGGQHVDTPIHAIRTQEVLPVQDLDVGAGPIGLLDARAVADQQPVLHRFQTQGRPVLVETSHIPSPPGETSVSQVQDNPHHVIHEVIRPVIQEIREIIQPYRRVTQEIRPVKEEVHSEVATGGPAIVGGAIAVAAPAPAVLAAPVPTVVRAQPTLVSAPAQAVYGSQIVGIQDAAPRSHWGVIAAPAPYYTGSYIQAFIDQIRSRQTESPIVVSQPQAVAVEPVPVEAVAQPVAQVVSAPKWVSQNRGFGQLTRKYVEY